MIKGPRTWLKQGTLWTNILRVTEEALRSGSLLPIPTGCEFVEEAGVRFIIRILSSLARKDEALSVQKRAVEQGKQSNPFLPYEKDLFVADLSDTHLAVLNKFNVVDHHLLIITRGFEDQKTMLTLRDFEALWQCLAEYPGLGFYNGGIIAGASQNHKHLQLVPLPLATEGPAVPIEPLLESAKLSDGVRTLDSLPFLHAFCSLASTPSESIPANAQNAFSMYADMLTKVGMKAPSSGIGNMQSGPYCLLATKEWMLLVPRSREFFEGISINSLGFAGALLVRNDLQLNAVKRHGPLSVLKAVAFPREQNLSQNRNSC